MMSRNGLGRLALCGYAGHGCGFGAGGSGAATARATATARGRASSTSAGRRKALVEDGGGAAGVVGGWGGGSGGVVGGSGDSGRHENKSLVQAKTTGKFVQLQKARAPVLYMDKHLVAVDKPPTVLAQPDISQAQSLPEALAEFLAHDSQEVMTRPPYVGVLHRLDKCVRLVWLLCGAVRYGAVRCGAVLLPGTDTTCFPYHPPDRALV